MDQRNIVYGGSHSKIEFCDLYSNQREIFHVKRYGQSSALSHLFAQGLVSGELFQRDEHFRREVNRKLPVSHRLESPKDRPARDHFRVIFAIITDKPGALQLPFFSRLNLRHAASRLEMYGFRVAKAKIVVEEAFRLMQRFRARGAQ